MDIYTFSPDKPSKAKQIIRIIKLILFSVFIVCLLIFVVFELLVSKNRFTPFGLSVVGNFVAWVVVTGAFSFIILLVLLLFSRWVKVAVGVILCIGLIVGFLLFVGGPIEVNGGDMEPAFQNHKIYYRDKLLYKFVPLKRGDVVVFQTQMVRIVGLPGETVEIKGDVIIVNGKILPEPYAVWKDTSIYQTYILDADSYLGIRDKRVRFQNILIMNKHDIRGKIL